MMLSRNCQTALRLMRPLALPSHTAMNKLIHRPSFMTPSGNRRWFAAADKEEGPGMGEQVKLATANALLKSLLCSTDGFDSAFNGLKIVRMGAGEISCTLEVDAKLQNPFNTLHGGAICTLVDFASTLALMTQDPTRPGVSVDLGVSFLSSAKAGDTLDIYSKVLKAGKQMGFTEVEIRNKNTGKLIASGRHTKFFS